MGKAVRYLTPSEVRKANKTYAKEQPWSAFLQVSRKGHEGRVEKTERVVVYARSRSEAFDKLRGKAVAYSQKHPGMVVVGSGVSHTPGSAGGTIRSVD